MVPRSQSATVSHRFQIEDLVTQNNLGVTFLATDTLTGTAVEVRRFFPSGPHGGGLDADEQDAFHAAAAPTIGVVHTSLRGVVAVGCDPVDGVPYVVTEHVAGYSLGEVVKSGPLPAEQATQVLVTALELSVALSELVGEEAVWVDTSPSAILLGDAESGRGITFCIDSARWVRGGDTRASLHGLVHLAEDLVGRRGRALGSKTGDELSRWLYWLRENAASTDVTAAWQLLREVAAHSNEATEHLTNLARQHAPHIRIQMVRRRSRAPKILVTIVALLLVGGGSWWWWDRYWRPQRMDEHPAFQPSGVRARVRTEPVASRSEPEPPILPGGEDPSSNVAPGASLVPSGSSGEVLQASPDAREPQTAPSTIKPDEEGLVFAPEQVNELMERRNRDVAIEGVLLSVIAARSGHSLYLEFSKTSPPFLARGILYVEGPDQMKAKEEIDAWLGKKIRMCGRVDIERFRVGDTQVARPKILMKSRDALKLAE
jgi:hypothetical protein